MTDSAVITKIQQHLFEHPIFRWIDSRENDMNVLVVGDTDYASAFVDLCLQTGQMTSHMLNVYWCIKQDSTQVAYWDNRPELKHFISVNDVWSNEKYAPYGHLYFKAYDEYLDSRICDGVRYAFIAGKDDNNNSEIASLFKNAVRNECLAAFLCDGNIQLSLYETDNTEHEESPYAHDLISSDEELERMAFNTHRIWEVTGNLDYEKAKERFLEPYNHKSSVSFVLSIPYKLNSIGISESDPYVAAKMLESILDSAQADPNSEAAGKIRELTQLEHRRWVIERICEGTKQLVDKKGNPEFASCISRSSVKRKDDNGNVIMHPCIVHSTEETPLSGSWYQDHNNWNNKSKWDDELDDLDRMSIDLHRAMKRAADQLRNNRKPLDDLILRLKAICRAGTDPMRRDFDRYSFCIENIIDKSIPYASQFETYEKMLLKSLDESLIPSANEGAEIIKSIKKMVFPLLEANQYRDYKKYDTDLVAHIPFILTGKKDVHICMPLGLISSKYANNQDFFTSVASVTALYATKITYLLLDESGSNPEVLRAKLKAISNYLLYRGRTCDTSLKIFSEKGRKTEALTAILEESLQNKYITDYEFFRYCNDEDLIESVPRCVGSIKPDYFDGSCLLSSSALINGKIIDRVSELVPYFEFDSYNKTFRNCKDCEYLIYTRLSSFIQVEDMFALMNAQDKEFNYPDCSDTYKDLWDIYCGRAIGEKNFPLCALCWTKTTNILKSGGGDNLQIDNKKMDTSDSSETRIVKKMLQELARREYLKNLRFTPDDCVHVNIRDKKTKKMFAKAGDLLEAYVYYEACKLDWFDDVQTGYKFKWEFDDVTNELDCVLTKGYRSILVECKSTKMPDEGFYLTLDSLADHFGIGYKKVLIMVTDIRRGSYDNYVSRGKQLDIITISSKNDLMNIGERLKEIMLKPL